MVLNLRILFSDSWLLCYSGCRVGANTKRYDDRVLAACRNGDMGLNCETLKFHCPESRHNRRIDGTNINAVGSDCSDEPLSCVLRDSTYAVQFNCILLRNGQLYMLSEVLSPCSSFRVCAYVSLNWTDVDFCKSFFNIISCTVRNKVQYSVFN